MPQQPAGREAVKDSRKSVANPDSMQRSASLSPWNTCLQLAAMNVINLLSRHSRARTICFCPAPTTNKTLIQSPCRHAVFSPAVHVQKQSRTTAKLQLQNYRMSEQELPLFAELTAPNGTKWNQPLGMACFGLLRANFNTNEKHGAGLFINNEFVKSKSGETLSSVSPM